MLNSDKVQTPLNILFSKINLKKKRLKSIEAKVYLLNMIKETNYKKVGLKSFKISIDYSNAPLKTKLYVLNKIKKTNYKKVGLKFFDATNNGDDLLRTKVCHVLNKIKETKTKKNKKKNRKFRIALVHGKKKIKRIFNSKKPFFKIRKTKFYRMSQRCVGYTDKNIYARAWSPFITYIVDVSFSKTNTSLHISDFSGNIKFFYSAGSVKIEGKRNKTYRKSALRRFYWLLTRSKFKFLKKAPIAIHVKNMNRWVEWFIKRITKRFSPTFVKFLINYPYNGCRKKKLRKQKRKSPVFKRSSGFLDYDEMFKAFDNANRERKKKRNLSLKTIQTEKNLT